MGSGKKGGEIQGCSPGIAMCHGGSRRLWNTGELLQVPSSSVVVQKGRIYGLP